MGDAWNRVQAAHAAMWRALGHDSPRWPLATEARFDGGYHLEVRDGRYLWIASDDRGTYVDLMETGDEDEALFWIAQDLTRTLAQHEAHAGGRSPVTRQWFLRQVELLRMIRPAWAERKLAQLRRDGLG